MEGSLRSDLYIKNFALRLKGATHGRNHSHCLG